MSGSGTRHFAKHIATGEEVVILGYRASMGEVLVAFLSAFSQNDAQQLRRLAASQEAQKKDFLLGTEPGSILMSAHHSTGKDWQTYVIREATGRSTRVRTVTLKDLEFYDPTQKAYFAGYGESIDPDADAIRKRRIEYQEAALGGKPLPPVPSEYEQIASTPAPAPTSSDPDMVAAITALAQGQAALLEAIQNLNKPEKKTTTRRKSTTTTRRTTKKADKTAQEVSASTDNNAENTTTASSSEEV